MDLLKCVIFTQRVGGALEGDVRQKVGIYWRFKGFQDSSHDQIDHSRCGSDEVYHLGVTHTRNVSVIHLHREVRDGKIRTDQIWRHLKNPRGLLFLLSFLVYLTVLTIIMRSPGRSLPSPLAGS